MSCRRVQERLSDYIDGELGPIQQLVTTLHLRHCGPCRAALRSLERTVAVLRRLGRDT